MKSLAAAGAITGARFVATLSVFLCAAFLSAAPAQAQDQTEQPVCYQFGSECDFYCDSAITHGCTADNYLVRFGGHFCQKFLDDNEKYSANGQLVLHDIRSCLIHSFDNKLFTCESVEDIAYQAHVDCYVDNGFCTLGALDRARILWTVRSQLTNPKFQNAASQIMRACEQ
jgi:hypothetical protein